MFNECEKNNLEVQCNICGEKFFYDDGNKHSCFPHLLKRIEKLERQVRGLETRESKWVL